MLRWFVFAVVVVCGLGLTMAPALERPVSEVAFSIAGFAVYAALGGLIIGRRDGHATGWLLLLVGLAVSFGDGVVFILGADNPMSDWVGSWIWPAVFAIFGAMTLTFPSGHLPDGDRWWPRIGRLSVYALPLLIIVTATTENLGGPMASLEMANPYGFLPAWLGTPALLTVVAILLGGVVSLVVNRRRSTGIERAQLTWVVFTFVLFITAIVCTFGIIFVTMAMGGEDPDDGVWTVVYLLMILFPASFGVAVLRYRLFDIDRIVSRTVSYTAIGAALALVYAGAVFVLRDLLPIEGPLPVAVSTLVVAALFNPLRRRIQARVDRRFNRSRYDIEVVMDRFASSLRNEVDGERLVEGWRDVVADTMQPASVAVWVKH